jgi:prevent-host-death family protein
MKTNVLKLRNALGQILEEVKASGEPLIVEKNREPIAVLISYQVFKQRFLDHLEKKKAENLVGEFRDNLGKAKASSLSVLRNMRYGADN